MQLDLTQEEVQSLVNVLGELPTKSNAFPLMMKIVKQAQDQSPKEQDHADTN